MGTTGINKNRNFFLAFLNHLIWSSLPVASRYLQVYAEPLSFDGQGVLCTAKATSALLIFACGGFFCPEIKKGGEEASQTVADGEQDSESRAEDDGGSDDGLPIPGFRKKVFFGLLFGMVATCRAALNIASSKFTLSYYITTINSLTPLVVSAGDSLILKADLPCAIWPCVIASSVGCAVIGFSHSPMINREPESSFTSDDAIGCSLQFASMCFSAAARLLMKRTEHILSRNEAVQTNNVCNVIFPLAYTLLSNPAGWKAFRHMSRESFLAWVTIAVFVYAIGSTGQMSLVRSMGPGMYSSLSAVRVLASALISAVWLNEPVRNWLEWLGLFITMVTMTLYTLASVDFTSFREQSGTEGSESIGDNDERDHPSLLQSIMTRVRQSPKDETLDLEMTAPLKSPQAAADDAKGKDHVMITWHL